ncbi:MAG: hypothetical protein K2X27_26235 [Candidatus Obscuribacterales bacterium]|nr:hypothetical protein [Candidatus Obscuribacterales bacterium]
MMITISQFTFRAFVFLCMLNFSASWLIGLFSMNEPSEAYMQMDIAGQRKCIERRLASGEAYLQGLLQPEGALFCYAFYGFSLVDSAVENNHDPRLRQAVIEKLEKLIPQIDQCCSEYPFTACKNIAPSGGIIAAGCANLLRAGYAYLGGQKADLLKTFHNNSAAIAESYRISKSPFLESFPNLRWPVDNLAALESLRLHDRLYKSKYFSQSSKRFIDWLSNNTDRESGMMIAQVDESGKILDVPRGCALSWSLAFLQGIAPELDRQQYALYRKKWLIKVLGTAGFREWWPGQEKFSSIKEGPVLFDIGAAASGLGIAATHAHKDKSALTGLLRGLEAIGFPSWNLQGEKSYLGQFFLLGDVLALWGKTCVPWDQENPQSEFPDLQLQNYQTVLLLASAISILLFSLSGFFLYRALQLLKSRSKDSYKKTELTFGAITASAILANLIFPSFAWYWTFSILTTSLALERWYGLIHRMRQA